MLIRDEEILSLPSVENLPTAEVFTIVWGHTMTSKQLIDFARANSLLSSTNLYESFCERRRIERLSIDILLGRLFGDTAELKRLPSGRPILHTASSYIYNKECSISHTGPYYALSLSPFRHGTDIERFREKALLVSEKFVSKEEESLFDFYRDTLQTNAHTATMIWSAKEAAYKYLDVPGLDFREDIKLEAINEHLLSVTVGRREAEVEIVPYDDFVLTTCLGPTL